MIPRSTAEEAALPAIGLVLGMIHWRGNWSIVFRLSGRPRRGGGTGAVLAVLAQRYNRVPLSAFSGMPVRRRWGIRDFF